MRPTDAAATPALSMIRLTIMSATSSVTSTGSAATCAIAQASCPSLGRPSSLRWTRTGWFCMADDVLSAQVVPSPV